MSNEKVLKSGYFEKQGEFRKNWQKKWWELTDSELRYYTEVGGALKGSILIRDILSVSLNDFSKTKQNTLYVLLTNKRSYWLAFENRMDCLEWQNAIEETKKRYITNMNNSLLLPQSNVKINGNINPQLAFLLQKMDVVESSKDLRSLLREVERIAVDLPPSEAIAQHQFVQDIIDRLRHKYPQLFDNNLDSYANSVLEIFYMSDSEGDSNETLSEFESPPYVDINSLYKFKETLGKGTYSIVKKARNRNSNEIVAIKVIIKRGMSEDDQTSLFREVSIMNRLRNHPNVIQLKGFYQDNDFFYIVQELAEGGELFDAIINKNYYSEREAQRVVRSLVYTIAYCHDRGIVHRDLKPENILLVSKHDDLSIKIADFGFARESRATNSLTTSCGTPGYLAPEILRGLAYGTPVDMWSIGVITYILLCGYPPFPTDNDATLYRRTMRGEYSFSTTEWENVSQDAKDFVKALLVVDPEHRATAKQACAMRWMRYESQSTMHMDGAMRMLENFNTKRRRNTSKDLQSIQQIADRSPAKQEPKDRYLTLYPTELRYAPSLNIESTEVLQPGTILATEQVVYTIDGTWLRLSNDCIVSLFVSKSKSPDYKPPLNLKWVCAEMRNENPLCVPINCLLYESLWEKDTALHNVRNAPSVESEHVGKLPSGQRYIATEEIVNDSGTWIHLHPQTIHTHKITTDECWLCCSLKNEAPFLQQIPFKT
ncbi:hypothetical protein WA158_005656 [Blastocystis sp. Blastoise]